MITFNDCSTKVYVFRMCRWGLKALRLLTGDNLTHMEREKNSGIRVNDHTEKKKKKKKKIHHNAFRFFHYARHEFKPSNGGREHKSRRLGDQHQRAFHGFACPRGISGPPLVGSQYLDNLMDQSYPGQRIVGDQGLRPCGQSLSGE